MGPTAFVSTIRTWLAYLIVATVLGAIIGFGVSIISPPTYASSVTLLITPAASSVPISFSDVEVAQALAPTFSELATTTPVLQRVLTETGATSTPDRLARAIETRVPAGTSLVEVTVNDPDPVMAAAIANAVAAELVAYPSRGLTDQPVGLKIALSVVDPAFVPTSQAGPGTLIRTAIGALVALFLTLAVIFTIENVRSGERLANVADKPGWIPRPKPATPPTWSRLHADEYEEDLARRRAGGIAEASSTKANDAD